MKTLPKIITFASLTLTFWCYSNKLTSELTYLPYNLNPFAKRIKEPIKTYEKPSPLEFTAIQSFPKENPANINYFKIQKEQICLFPRKSEEEPAIIYLNNHR